MAYIMGLEGPKLRPLDRARTELALPALRDVPRLGERAAPWSSWWYKFGISPQIWFGIFGLVGGAYLAGSSRGQQLVARFRRR